MILISSIVQRNSGNTLLSKESIWQTTQDNLDLKKTENTTTVWQRFLKELLASKEVDLMIHG
jgi:hypothetical protein